MFVVVVVVVVVLVTVFVVVELIVFAAFNGNLTTPRMPGVAVTKTLYLINDNNDNNVKRFIVVQHGSRMNCVRRR